MPITQMGAQYINQYKTAYITSLVAFCENPHWY